MSGFDALQDNALMVFQLQLSKKHPIRNSELCKGRWFKKQLKTPLALIEYVSHHRHPRPLALTEEDFLSGHQLASSSPEPHIRRDAGNATLWDIRSVHRGWLSHFLMQKENHSEGNVSNIYKEFSAKGLCTCAVLQKPR